MQVIMTANMSDEVDINMRTRYSSSCATVLRQLGVEVPWKTVITTVPAAFVEIMHVLSKIEMVRCVPAPLSIMLTKCQTRSLTALLDLMARLCFSIKDFSSALLQTTGMDARMPDGSLIPDSLNLALFHVVNKYVRMKPEQEALQDHRLLSEAALNFMEGLLFNVSDELAER
jgi:hypothetical protein